MFSLILGMKGIGIRIRVIVSIKVDVHVYQIMRIKLHIRRVAAIRTRSVNWSVLICLIFDTDALFVATVTRDQSKLFTCRFFSTSTLAANQWQGFASRRVFSFRNSYLVKGIFIVETINFIGTSYSNENC